MKDRQVTNKKTTFQVRLDIGWKKILLGLRAETGRSMKELIEEVLGDYYGLDSTPVASSRESIGAYGK